MGARSSTLVAFLLALGASGAAHAQLPFLGAEAKAPDVRIAGRDLLADELERFLTAIEPALEEAEAELRRLETDGGGAADPALQRSLLALARQRVQHLGSARATARGSLEAAKAPLPAAEPTDLDRLVALARVADRRAASQREAERYAARLEAMSSEADRPAGGAQEAAERAARLARARAAEARALQARGQARRASRIRDAARAQLEISPLGAMQSKLRLDEAEQRLARLEDEAMPTPPVEGPPVGTSSVAAERFAQQALHLADARSDLRLHKLRRARAEQLAAQALVWGYAALAEVAATQPPTLDATALRGRQLALEDERARRVDELAQLRRTLEADKGMVWHELERAHVRASELALTELITEQHGVAEALATVEVVTRVLRERRSRPGLQNALLVALTLVAGFLLLRYGGRWLTLLLAPGISGLSLGERAAARARVIASLLWPLAVGLGTTAVIVWPVLGLQLTVLEALEVLERPLFYVETTGVSVRSLVQFVLTIWVAVVVSRFLRGFLTERLYGRMGWDIGLTNALDTLAHYLVLLTGIVLGLRSVGVGFSSLAILAGVLGIGIGFGLRNITENFISGLIILAERPIKIGDFIEVKDGEVEGRVESIRARSTTVITRDNISMIIPNSEFVARPVVNWSHGDPKVRVSVPVGVAYGSDTDLVRRVLLEVAGRHGQVLKKPGPEVHFRAFGASSLDFLVLVWIEEQAHRFRIASDLHFAIDKAFRKHGIEIAFPQLDLHFKSMYPAFAGRLHEVPVPPPADDGPKIPDRKSILTRSGTPRASSKMGGEDPGAGG